MENISIVSVYFEKPKPFEIEGKLYSFKRLKVREPQKIITLIKNVYLLAIADMQTYMDRFPNFNIEKFGDIGKYLEVAFSSEYALNYLLDIIKSKLVILEADSEIDVTDEDFENLPPHASVILIEEFYKHPDLKTFKEKVLGLKDHPLLKGLLNQTQKQ